MKTLFEEAVADDLKQRLAQLRPDSQPLWGSMTVAQALAHCSLGLELADGKRRPPRMFLGRLVGAVIKQKAFGNDEPMRRDSPTMIAVKDEREFESEREQLYRSIDKFLAAGPEACTTHPHSFFGKLTPDEWAELMYKHLDHHLRQFGA